jgi:hypothetical protein
MLLLRGGLAGLWAWKEAVLRRSFLEVLAVLEDADRGAR